IDFLKPVFRKATSSRWRTKRFPLFEIVVFVFIECKYFAGKFMARIQSININFYRIADGKVIVGFIEVIYNKSDCTISFRREYTQSIARTVAGNTYPCLLQHRQE